MNIVYARVTGVVTWNAARVRLAQDDPWNADDPFVKAHPQHFADRPLRLFGSGGAELDVEQATAAPGEKRNTRRSK